MTKAIFITNGNNAFNQVIATSLLESGHWVTLHMETEQEATQYVQSLPNEWLGKLHISIVDLKDELSYMQAVEKAITVMDTLDIFVHGNEMLDEEGILLESSEALVEVISEAFERIFLWNKAAISHMMLRKSGKVLFPIIYDTLYYDQYSSSPIMNHGKISLMKCMSRECSAFRIDVNVMTFGYHNADFDKNEKKEKQQLLEIYGLKPALKPLGEMVSMLNILINTPNQLIGGQNIEIGVGIETNI